MAKKGSKNAIENRGKRTIKTCDVCNQKQKAIMVLPKKKLVFECICGFRTKQGDMVEL